ncbi:LCP family protein [Streptomyces sp. XD-27]|uniref:LCP family protein n=1 Tax=Streptomyces sp. XD-27 TaxID=3062779 RepID=UPI0026F416BB|nr:LCP family protein [Streptomyces sp. XD-27]WKX70293.1 LCP family protein [Streptomyces sp. XD-27]
MNDGQDPYARDPYDPQQPQVYGYDAYGRPVYQQPQQPAQQDEYGYSYDPYGQQAPPQQQPPQPQPYDPYGRQQDTGYGFYGRQQAGTQPGYDPYAAQQQAQQTGLQPPSSRPQQPIGHVPQQQDYATYDDTGTQHADPGAQHSVPGAQRLVPPQREREPAAPGRPPRRPGPERGEEPQDGPYRTDQFSFVEEPDEDSEDVIDWLKFAETRTERRDERRRKTRNRLIALTVVLVLAAAGGVGYLWHAGKLPGMSDGTQEQARPGGPQQRDVIVVHLRETRGGDSSTALLVDNETTKKGTTVLLPNALAVASEEGGPTTLGKLVEGESSDATRDALGTLLGSKIEGTWRLDTPYLENLVELVGGVTVDTDVAVPAKKGEETLVKQGKEQTLSGQAAVAYATYRAPAEAQAKQLARFGQVMRAVLNKMPSDADDATKTVEALVQIPDPSLTERDLGSSLADLAEQAKTGAYDTTLLPVQQDGTLSERATERVVKDILGGTVRNTDQGGVTRISLRNASGKESAAGAAQVTLVNGGFTVVGASAENTAQATSRVTYADDRHAKQAEEVAKTLGLPTSAVHKGKGAFNADVTVVLGRDYKGSVG